MLDLLAEYLTDDQRARLKSAGYVLVRVDHSLADKVTYHARVDHETVVQVLDTLRAIA